MKCWICDKQIEGKMIELTKHFYTHTKSELITKMIWYHYNIPTTDDPEIEEYLHGGRRPAGAGL